MGRGTVCSSLVPDPRSMVPLPSAHCQMPSALSNPTLNGHALPNRNGSISLSPQSDPSASSARSAVSSDSPHFVAPSLGRSVASSTDAWSPVPGPLSLNNNELITDLLAGEFLLPYIAARHNVPLSALNAWVESEEVQSLLASCRRISEWRARFIALDSIPRSIHGLITTMNQCPGTEKARRAATTIINLAFKKDLSIPLGATGRARSDERDQCRSPHAPRHHSGSTHPTSDIAHPTSHSPSHPLTSSPSHPSHDWPARSARGSSQTSPSLSDAARAETPVPESSTPVSGSFSVQVPEHQDSSASSARSAVHPLPDSRAPT